MRGAWLGHRVLLAGGLGQRAEGGPLGHEGRLGRVPVVLWLQVHLLHVPVLS